MPTVVLGNVAPIVVDVDANPVDPPPEARHLVEIDNGRQDNHSVTTFTIPEGTALLEAVATVRAAFSGFHSAEPPAFVASDDPALQLVLSAEFGCPTEPPRGFKAKDLVPRFEEDDAGDQKAPRRTRNDHPRKAGA